MMRPGWLTEAQEVEALQIVNEPGPGGRIGGRRALMDAFGIGEKRARTLARWLKGADDARAGGTAPAATDQWQITKTDKEFRILSKGASVTNAEDAVAKAGLDLSEWYIHETVANTYTTAMKDPDGHPLIVENYQVKVTLRRRVSEAIHDGLDMIADKIADRTPAYDREFPAVKTGADLMLELSLCDQHLGKLSWEPEVGDDYDIQIAEDLYIGAVRDTVSRVGNRPIEEILLPVGGDFFNYDNARGETAGGTPQDNDSRPAKVFKTGFFTVLNAIEVAIKIAPVRVVWVSGNHDPSWSFHLVVALHGAFRNSDRVTVDLDPMPRKYIEYGTNLIGVAHGDMPVAQWKQFGLLMATEAPEAWARTKCREVHTGHLHTRKAVMGPLYDEYHGVIVRRLPSMTGTDLWHFNSGYTGNARLTESYVWDKARGLDSIIMSRG